jgi:hypothetical protein
LGRSVLLGRANERVIELPLAFLAHT